jgi:hypothetical protein
VESLHRSSLRHLLPTRLDCGARMRRIVMLARVVAPLLQPGMGPPSVRQFHRTKGDLRMNTRSIAITSTFVCALVSGAYAQRGDALRSSQQQQAQGLRQAAAGRLIVPITGTLTTPVTTTPPTELTSPPQQPPTTPSQQSPATPSQQLPTTPQQPSTTATPTTPGSNGDATAPITGSFAIRRFAQTTAGEVAAVGVLTLSLTDPASGAGRTIVTEAAMPIARSVDEANSPAPSPAAMPSNVTSSATLSADSRATSDASAQGCETLNLALAPVQIDLLGMAVQLDQVNVDFIARTTGRLRTMLCGATSGMDRGVAATERMNMLNTLLDAVG